MLVKVYATGLTLGSGGNGGNFAPSLFVGSYLGFVITKFLNISGIDKDVSVSNFTLVGMAGILLISGLPQVEDHLLGVEVIAEYLARKGEQSAIH